MSAVPPLAALEREAGVAALVALGAALQVCEAMIPGVGPWFRPGLANVATMLALLWGGPRLALLVAVLRAALGALVLGTLLSPTFLISLTGGLAAWAAMTLARLPGWFSAAGIGLAGGLAHVTGQVAAVQALVAPQASLWGLWPWLAPQAGVAGWIVGALSGYIAERAAWAWWQQQEHATNGGV